MNVDAEKEVVVVENFLETSCPSLDPAQLVEGVEFQRLLARARVVVVSDHRSLFSVPLELFELPRSAPAAPASPSPPLLPSPHGSAHPSWAAEA